MVGQGFGGDSTQQATQRGVVAGAQQAEGEDERFEIAGRSASRAGQGVALAEALHKRVDEGPPCALSANLLNYRRSIAASFSLRKGANLP